MSATTPQLALLPTAPRRVHPIDTVFSVLAVGLRDIAFAVIFILSTGWWWLLVVGPLLALASSSVRWARFTWWVDDDRVIVDRGVVQRTHRELPIDRIQQIEVIRTLRHQVLGVSTLRIETAGGEPGGEVDLLLSERDAVGTRAGLLALRDAGPAGNAGRVSTGAGIPPPAPPEQVLLHLGPGRLALAGLVGPQLFALPIAIIWLLSLLDDLPAAFRPDVDTDEVRLAGLAAIAGLVVLVLVIWIVVAMLAGILAHHDLTVSVGGGDLRLRRGLLDHREVSVPVSRVQLARVTQHPVLSMFGLVALRLDSAGGQSTADATHIRVPTLTRDEAERILAVALPVAVGHPALEPAPRRALPRSLLRSVTRGVLVATVALVLIRPSPTWWIGALLVAIVFGLAHGTLAWRGLGAHISEALIAARRGAIVRTSSYVPTEKAQSARATATVFQRRRRLVTGFVDVAGQRSPPALADRDRAEAGHLARVVPGAARADEHALRTATGLGRPPRPVA